MQPQYTCEHCGRQFGRSGSRIPRFCSRACRRAVQGKVPQTCAQCGITWQAWPYHVRNGRAYCSNRCRFEAQRRGWRGPLEELTCRGCGTAFRAWPYQVRNGIRYCSGGCRKNALRQMGERCCEVCGARFHPTGQQVRQGGGKYCSMRCYGLASRKRSIADPGRSSWAYNAWRTAVYERDRYTCCRCGQVGGALHAHHIRPYAVDKAGRVDVTNGVTLCVACHQALHSEGA